ncbi:hypothetical protein DCC85_15995 [Paenibacillus sp. CAA11]|nr:hypothetical protein DCC85_15995 [Paenibacillus sp. CAA11]
MVTRITDFCCCVKTPSRPHQKLKPLITEGNELNSYRVNAKPLKPEQYRELNEADVIVLAFPLYFDAIPSHLLRQP